MDNISTYNASLTNVQLRHVLVRRSDEVHSVAWSSNGHTLAAGKDRSIQLWDAETGMLRQILEGHTAAVLAVAWSPDGRLIASGSLDKTIRLWDAQTGGLLHIMEGQTAPITCLAWSPSSNTLASGGIGSVIHLWNVQAGTILGVFESYPVLTMAWSPDERKLVTGGGNNNLQLWNVGTGTLLQTLEGHTAGVLAAVWSPDSKSIASGSRDKTIRLWDAETGKVKQVLEGHRSSVISLAWSGDGQILGAASDDNCVRLWRCDTWETVKIFDSPDPELLSFGISFQPTISDLSFVEDAAISAWELDTNALLNLPPIVASIQHSSAKVVILGESNVGKSCLALRLAEDRYEEQTTTHGMRIWSLVPEQLSANAIVSAGERSELILWDMGGQEEYRLVHQLFLQDTTLALVLFDPTRGRTAYDEVIDWNLRLEKQLQGHKAIKLLVGTKVDVTNDYIDNASLNRLVKECGFAGYYETSAKTGRGISELREAIYNSVDWSGLARTSRPILFQQIRDQIQKRRSNGEVLLLYSDLVAQIREREIPDFHSMAIEIVVEQLAIQGLIIDTRLMSGERILVLQISEIERYAGSLIIAARNNPRGVPAIEKHKIATANMSFPGIREGERLSRFQERVILECVIQLLLEHGICFEHEGLIIFPSLFRSMDVSNFEDSISQSISIYYDFSGAVDNIYSSLVARLAVGERFGRVRLWEDRAEFEQAGQGVCGLRIVRHIRGGARLDLFFSQQTPSEIRDLFIVFVEEHLRKEGVTITEALEVACGNCGYGFEESLLRKRLANGFSDIVCPVCETRVKINEGARKIRATNPDIEKSLLALKTTIEQKSQDVITSFRDAFGASERNYSSTDTIRILHLSDLFLAPNVDIGSVLLKPLISDLKNNEGGLCVSQLDFLVISGDLTRRADASEFESAHRFISTLINYFGLSAERCIIVPGNHDISWDESVYEWKRQRLVNLDALEPGSYVTFGNSVLIRNDQKYPDRFKNFKNFYHSLFQREYALKHEELCSPILFEELGVQFLAINSVWEADEFFPDRTNVNPIALKKGIQKANEQIKEAERRGRLQRNVGMLRIAVLHNPVTGSGQISNANDLLALLHREDFQLCLHGHIHEKHAGVVSYLTAQNINLVGAGSLGVLSDTSDQARLSLYNLIEVKRDLSRLRVHTRCLRKDGGMWEGWAIWPGQDSHERRTYYDVVLPHSRLEELAKSDEVIERIRAAKLLISQLSVRKADSGKIDWRRKFLLKLAEDSSNEVRDVILSGLLESYEEIDLPISEFISKFSEDKDETLRGRVARWILTRFSQVGQEFEQVLFTLMKDRSGYVREAIVQTVAMRFEELPENIVQLAKDLTGPRVAIELVSGGGMIINTPTQLVLAVTNHNLNSVEHVDVELQESADFTIESANPIHLNALMPGATQKVSFTICPRVALELSLSIKVNGTIVSPAIRIVAISDIPYVYGNPISNPTAFFGRERELNDVFQAVTKPNKQDILLIGERRSGKTSLLYQIQRQLQLPYVPVYVVINEAPADVLGVVQHIVRKVISALIELKVLAVDPWNQFHCTNESLTDNLKIILDAALKKYPDLKIILLADEGDYLLKLDDRMQNILRATLQSQDVGFSLRAVFAGTSVLSTYVSKKSSPFFNHFRSVSLLPLDEVDTYNLITKPAAVFGYSFSEDAIDNIYEACGGHPYYCQRICYEAFAIAITREQKLIDNQISQDAISKVVESSSDDAFKGFKTYFWDEAYSDERTFMKQLAKKKQAKIKAEAGLERLIDWQIIKKQGDVYIFTANLFREWIKRL